MSKVPFVLGRLLFGGFFLYGGIHHFQQLKGLSRYAGAKHVPNPDIAVAVSGAALVLGEASLLLGIKPKAGAAAVAAFLGAISPVMHDFWNQQDPQQKQTEMVNFTKNLALLGAALTLMSVEQPKIAA
jgi:putative oxidoreductase